MDSFASLFASWRNYALKQGEEPGTTKRLSEGLQRFDYMPIKDAPGLRGGGLRGLKVNSEPVDETGSAAHVSCDVCDRRDAIFSSDIHARAWVDNKASSLFGVGSDSQSRG